MISLNRIWTKLNYILHGFFPVCKIYIGSARAHANSDLFLSWFLSFLLNLVQMFRFSLSLYIRLRSTWNVNVLARGESLFANKQRAESDNQILHFIRIHLLFRLKNWNCGWAWDGCWCSFTLPLLLTMLCCCCCCNCCCCCAAMCCWCWDNISTFKGCWSWARSGGCLERLILIINKQKYFF